jgi:putative effector of murein hydrolase
MIAVLAPVWTYLQTAQLSGLLATLLTWLAAGTISRRLGHPSWASPPLLAILLLIALLLLTRTSYAAYMTGAQYVAFLLGPATVALAVPMYANLRLMRRSARAMIPALLAGSLVTAGSAMLLAWLLGAPRLLILSLGPKSVTVPIAMGIAEKIHGQPSLTAAFVMLTALIGVLTMAPLFRLLGVRDLRAQGLAAGTVAHGIATARMLLISETAGAFGGLAIGLNAVLTALFLPLAAHLLGW